MTRLIDADEFKSVFTKKSTEAVCGAELCKAIISRIDDQPTVDAVSVIRCKECKYYSCGTVEGKHLCMSVKYRFTPTTEDEWCSRAERKEE